MDKLKTILTLVAIILGALIVLAGISLIYSVLGYLLLFGIVCLGALVAYGLLRKPDHPNLPGPDPQRELEKVQRLLEEYKRK
jgi:hypothetical protein